MPKPVTKEQLLTAMQKERQALEQLLEKLSPAEMVQTSSLDD